MDSFTIEGRRSFSNMCQTARRGCFKVQTITCKEALLTIIARLSVHFQTVLDTLIPYDTIFSFTAPGELSDSALGLSGIAPSIGSESASNSSLRQQRLNQIAEDNEEVVAPTAAKPTKSPTRAREPVLETEPEPALAPSSPPNPKPAEPVPVKQREVDSIVPSISEDSSLPASATKAKAMLAKRREQDATYEASVRMSHNRDSQASFVKGEEILSVEPREQLQPLIKVPTRTSSIAVDKQLPLPPAPPTPPPPAEADKPKPAVKTEEHPYRVSIDQSLLNFEVESDSDDDLRRPTPKAYAQPKEKPRFSNLLSADENTSINRWTENVSASTTRTKERTSRESTHRPRTAGGIDVANPRPVANLPTSVRATNRPSREMSRPGSQQSSRSVPIRWTPSANLPPPLPSPTFPTVTQPAAFARKAPSNTGSYAGEVSAPTPEKLRLMKALQMRKRNQLLAQRSRSAASSMLDGPRFEREDNDVILVQNTKLEDPKAHLNIAPELASINESVVTSPTSINTTSDNQSTKPSSVSEHSLAHKSVSSLSSDTNSSTTPRADVEESRSSGGTRNILRDTPGQTTEEKQTSSAASVADTITPQPAIGSPNVDLPVQNQPLSEDRSTAIIQTAGPRKKRYHFEGTIHIPPLAQPLDGSDDEDLMDELQNATLQEAKPVAVNRTRTPITPVFARIPTREPTPIRTINVKARSTSYDSQATTPDKLRTASRSGSVLSLATALPQWPPQNVENLPALPKQKLTIGATISKRVKTFEGLSQRDPLAHSNSISQRDPPTRAASASHMLKRTSFLHGSEKPVERSTSQNILSLSRTDSDQAEKPMRPWVQRSGTAPEIMLPKQMGESVSVTARIVRDAPKSAHGTGNALNMHRSTLIVERGIEPDPNKSSDSLLLSLRDDRRRFSITSHQSGSKAISPTETTHKPNRMSLSSFKRQSRPPSISETSSVTDQKRPSKTSRMLKRLSGLGKSRNRDSTLISPTQESLHPDTIQEAGELQPDMRHVVDIGEVNVQFADSLLWKRRFLRVDDHGFLIFAPPVNEANVRGKSRKIHLDELLYKPYLPDREREEMAWSILLDLKSGGTVQCACESNHAQSAVLKMLIDAHAAYNQLYGG